MASKPEFDKLFSWENKNILTSKRVEKHGGKLKSGFSGNPIWEDVDFEGLI